MSKNSEIINKSKKEDIEDNIKGYVSDGEQKENIEDDIKGYVSDDEQKEKENQRKRSEETRKKYSSTNNAAGYNLNRSRQILLNSYITKNNSDQYNIFCNLLNYNLQDSETRYILQATSYTNPYSLAFKIFSKSNKEDRKNMLVKSYNDDKISDAGLELILLLAENLELENINDEVEFEKNLEAKRQNYQTSFDRNDHLKYAKNASDVNKINEEITDQKISFLDKTNQLKMEDDDLVSNLESNRKQQDFINQLISSNNFDRFCKIISSNKVEIADEIFSLSNEDLICQALEKEDMKLPNFINKEGKNLNVISDKFSMFNLIWNFIDTREEPQKSALQNKVFSQQRYHIIHQTIATKDPELVVKLCSKFIRMKEPSIELKKNLLNWAENLLGKDSDLCDIITCALLIKEPKKNENSPENEEFQEKLNNLKEFLSLQDAKATFIRLKNEYVKNINEKVNSKKEEFSKSYIQKIKNEIVTTALCDTLRDLTANQTNIVCKPTLTRLLQNNQKALG